jgi:hypothetical protein
MKLLTKIALLFAVFLTVASSAGAQGVPEGFQYQAVLYDASGLVLSAQTVDLRIGLISNNISGTLEFEEEHTVTTDNFGLVSLIIGQGTSTGNGAVAQFSAILWSADDMFVNVALDQMQSGSFVNIATTQLFAVPYAMHSKTTDQQYAISGLADVDTTGLQIGHNLIWDGTNWIPGVSSINIDTAIYAVDAGSANYSDTATYALNAQNIIPSDTALFAWHADSANYAAIAGFAAFADSANYADTASWAWNAAGKWNLMGNALTGGEFVGTTSNDHLIMKTNNIERMRIDSVGKVGIGTANPIAQLHVKSDQGVLFGGDFGVGPAMDFSGNRLVWYPRKSHFYSGSDAGGLFGMGDYSFGTGYKSWSVGDYSFVMGYNSRADGDAAFSGGYLSWARADYSLAFGYQSEVSPGGTAGIAMGRDARVTYPYGVALGYHAHSFGEGAIAIGFQTESKAAHSFTIGYRAIADHVGAFVFGDQSTSSYVHSTAANQFMVRAQGGTIFYTNAGLTAGVSLAGGAGAWATISDSTKKENFGEVDLTEILQKVEAMEVSQWNYKAQHDSIVHMGPMAQDFYAAFKLGQGETTITTTDIDGVNLAAIKALIEQTRTLEEKASELEDLKEDQAVLYERIERLEALILQLVEATASNR